MPFVYKYVGDSPVSLPAQGLENVRPGAKVETAEALNHPAFEEVVQPKAAEKPADKESK